MSMRYESESGQLVENPTEADLNQLLSQIDGDRNSYASLTMPDGNYIQVGGGPDEFTVEIRENQHGGSFRHLKAAGAKPEKNGERHLVIGGENVSVAPNQILDLSTASRLFRFFLHQHTPDPSIAWQDITPMFSN